MIGPEYTKGGIDKGVGEVRHMRMPSYKSRERGGGRGGRGLGGGDMLCEGGGKKAGGARPLTPLPPNQESSDGAKWPRPLG